MTEPILQVRDLTKAFPIRTGFLEQLVQRGERPAVRAIDNVSLELAEGEVLGIVGESGCGKSTTGLTILRLVEPTSGTVRFLGEAVPTGGRDLLRFRRLAQIIFQDPYQSLNPRFTIFDIVGEPLIIHGLARGGELRERVVTTLDKVGLRPPGSFLHRYPHELSGGQRQRVVIARAIALRPRLVVADEPVSALDMSIRAQILETLAELKKTYNLTYLYITHDLGVVRSICDRVGVMYLGKLVEVTGVEELYARPLHPYTKLLLEANPIPRPTQARARRRGVIRGEIPSPSNPPSGCRFHPRCPVAEPRCALEEPTVVSVGGTLVACHLYTEGGQ
jgi:oligopeptide/dipeptide ABC transporter ATP-binding protein